MNQLDRQNKHGVSVREAITYWLIGEASLASDASELDGHPQGASVASVWHRLTPQTQERVANAWCEDCG